ncbi:hypothetical protein RAS2_25420 [Phycisphaerae bacterium RAS2]|nr:hypothetical protein RAS2_25420 [Phycisphaerae bacterium RAS2]
MTSRSAIDGSNSRSACYTLVVVATALISLMPDVVSAQQAPPKKKLKAGGLSSRPTYMSAVGTGGTWVGMKTRIDILRDFDGLTGRASDRYRGYYRPSPMRELIDRQSLVLPRSRMGMRLAESRGFTLERKEMVTRAPRIGEISERMIESSGGSNGSASSMPSDSLAERGTGEPVSEADSASLLMGGSYLHREGFRESTDGTLERVERRTYQDFLEQRIKQRAEEAYETGLGYARLYDPLELTKSSHALITARSFFELYRDASRDKAKPYFAVGIVSFLNKDYSRAYSNLRDGILRVQTAEDLLIERDRFFKDPAYFRDLFDTASTFCSAVNDRAMTAVIISYTAFLYGDMSTSLSAADSMKGLSDPELVEAADRYRKALVEAGAGSKVQGVSNKEQGTGNAEQKP